MPKFEIFASEEQVYVQCVSLPQPVFLTEDKLALLLEVHRYMFSDLLKFNSPSLTYDVDRSEVAFCVVPLVKERGKDCAINWALVDKLLCHMRCQNKRPTDEERRKLVFDKTRYINSIIFPWYHRRVGIDDFVRVVAIRNDMSPLSPCGFGGFASFADYYEKSHNLKIFNLAQPLLCGDYVRPRYDMIRRRVKGDSCEAVMIGSDPAAHAYAGSMFVPELVYVHPLSWPMWFQLTCLPTVLHRLRCLAVADELRTTIQKGAFPSDGVQLAEDQEALPIDSNWYRANGYATGNKRKHVANESCDGAASEPNVGLLVQFEGMNESYFNNVCGSKQTDATTTTATVSSSACKELDEEQLFFHQPVMPTGAAVENIRMEGTFLNNAIPASFVHTGRSNFVLRGQTESAEIEQLTNGNIAEATADVLSNSSASVVASFFKEFTTKRRLQPELREILLALTCSGANDLFDMENAETLGDSFLKYAVADCMFKMHPDKQPGQLSDLRRKEISNVNLCQLGKRIGLCGMIITQEFRPMVNWLPPGFVMSQQPDDNTALDDDSANAEENLQLVERHVVSDKRVADCVEALIGVYVRSCGHDRALKFMEWLGLTVVCEVSFDSDFLNDH
ncbi:RNase3 domain protein [Trichuris suis]|nr:RNase3 domain protein [Trichuris suis]